MNKREVVWLIVKLIGLYLVYSAVTAGFNFFGTFFTTMQTPDLFSKSIPMFLSPFLLIVVEVITGIYLLKDGALLFDILIGEGPGRDS